MGRGELGLPEQRVDEEPARRFCGGSRDRRQGPHAGEADRRGVRRRGALRLARRPHRPRRARVAPLRKEPTTPEPPEPAVPRRWGPDGRTAAVSVTFDNLGEAMELSRGTWPPHAAVV